jgi:hypothetical protein
MIARPLRHGLYDDPVLWSLSGARAKDRNIASIKHCPFCDAVIPLAVRRCPACQVRLVGPDNERRAVPLYRDDTLVPFEVGSVEWLWAASYDAVRRWAGADRERLNLIKTLRGYGDWWVEAQWRWAQRAHTATAS